MAQKNTHANNLQPFLKAAQVILSPHETSVRSPTTLRPVLIFLVPGMIGWALHQKGIIPLPPR
jgi:hypothetical protein